MYLITPDTPQEWIDEGWAWYNAKIAEQTLQASTSAPAPTQPSPSAQPTAHLSPLTAAPVIPYGTPAPAPTPLQPALAPKQKPRRPIKEVLEVNGYWPAKRILRETVHSYLIEWEADPRTGEEFEPNWEPKEHATRALKAEWEERRRVRREGYGQN